MNGAGEVSQAGLLPDFSNVRMRAPDAAGYCVGKAGASEQEISDTVCRAGLLLLNYFFERRLSALQKNGAKIFTTTPLFPQAGQKFDARDFAGCLVALCWPYTLAYPLRRFLDSRDD
ncbi:MAG: hypothetical protein ACRYF8_17680 [Janthinobacterium lividum]